MIGDSKINETTIVMPAKDIRVFGNLLKLHYFSLSLLTPHSSL
jgi:hypothetical protein